MLAPMLMAMLVAGCAHRPQTPKYEAPPSRGQYASPAAQRLRAGAAGANLIVIVLDAARADRFGAYGYRWNTTPNSDKLLAESVVFDEAYCTAARRRHVYPLPNPDTHGTLPSAE
jgi:glucan phosphoethanolaminetransferase (alkaline phosphatase superfamily)